MVYPALLPLMHAPRLPVVDWTDAPADLNGLARFAERRNLVSLRVPSHFKHSLPIYQTTVTIQTITILPSNIPFLPKHTTTKVMERWSHVSLVAQSIRHYPKETALLQPAGQEVAQVIWCDGKIPAIVSDRPLLWAEESQLVQNIQTYENKWFICMHPTEHKQLPQ
jgi:hypothetical protein